MYTESILHPCNITPGPSPVRTYNHTFKQKPNEYKKNKQMLLKPFPTAAQRHIFRWQQKD